MVQAICQTCCARSIIHVAMCLKKNHGSLLVLNLLPQVFKECFTHIDEKFSMARLKNSTDASAASVRFCSSQPSIVNWLSSPIFPCSVGCLFVPPWWHLTKSHFYLPPNPYIFWKLMIIAIHKWIRITNTKTKTNKKTMTKTKTRRE